MMPMIARTPARTYVTDITHYLNAEGELAAMPGDARKLASFLVLLIDAASRAIPARNSDTRIRCRTRDCTGAIRALIASSEGKIVWHCPECGHNGVVSNWQGTKWDQTR
jgi:predicted RNA-binding Zn-ribbon protein involved in translation (DUF1610 family)